MEEFDKDISILITPCSHSFHELCLMNWINLRIDKSIKDSKKNDDGPTNVIDAPDCPNCNQSLSKAAELREE